MFNRRMLWPALLAWLCSASFGALALADDSVQVDIAAGDLRVALESLARQSGIELVYRTEELDGLRTPGVSGRLSPRHALRKLLEGTSLQVHVDASGALLITAAPRDSSRSF